jgi:hypothetical protein
MVIGRWLYWGSWSVWLYLFLFLASNDDGIHIFFGGGLIWTALCPREEGEACNSDYETQLDLGWNILGWRLFGHCWIVLERAIRVSYLRHSGSFVDSFQQAYEKNISRLHSSHQIRALSDLHPSGSILPVLPLCSGPNTPVHAHFEAEKNHAYHIHNQHPTRPQSHRRCNCRFYLLLPCWAQVFCGISPPRFECCKRCRIPLRYP